MARDKNNSEHSQKPTTLLEEVQSTTHIPGIAIAISSKEVITTQSVGVTNANDPEEVTDATVFEAASLSKPVFAYMVLKLAKENKIDLDKPLYEYGDFDYFPKAMKDNENYKKLTARMILSHQAGLPNEFNPPKVPVDFIATPGEKFNYSGVSYHFLGFVVEKITATSLEALAQDEFRQIGMTNTSFMPPTGCSLIRLKDKEELTSETVEALLNDQLDRHGKRLSIIYHKEKLFVAERLKDGSLQITEKESNQVGESNFQKIKARFAEIPEFLWSKPIPIEARELLLATAIVGHPPEHAATVATGHYSDGSVNPNQRFYGVHPAGSLYTTASDYAKFLNACTADSYIRKEMFEPVVFLTDKDTKAIDKGVTPEDLKQLSWGAGICLQTNPDGSRVAIQWGDIGTGRNLAAKNLTTGDTFVCLTNSEDGPRAFRPLAEPVIGDIGPMSEWLSIREGLPMEKTNPTQDIKERLSLLITDSEQEVEQKNASPGLS